MSAGTKACLRCPLRFVDIYKPAKGDRTHDRPTAVAPGRPLPLPQPLLADPSIAGLLPLYLLSYCSPHDTKRDGRLGPLRLGIRAAAAAQSLKETAAAADTTASFSCSCSNNCSAKATTAAPAAAARTASAKLPTPDQESAAAPAAGAACLWESGYERQKVRERIMVHTKHILLVVHDSTPSSPSIFVSVMPGALANCAPPSSPSTAAPDASSSATALMAGACAALPKHSHLPTWGDRSRPLAARARLPPPPLGRRRRQPGPQPWRCPLPRGRRRPVPRSRCTRRSSCPRRPGRSAAPPRSSTSRPSRRGPGTPTCPRSAASCCRPSPASPRCPAAAPAPPWGQRRTSPVRLHPPRPRRWERLS